MSLEENFETYLKEKYANEEKEQNTETDNPKSLFVETNKLSSHIGFDMCQSSMAILLV